MKYKCSKLHQQKPNFFRFRPRYQVLLNSGPIIQPNSRHLFPTKNMFFILLAFLKKKKKVELPSTRWNSPGDVTRTSWASFSRAKDDIVQLFSFTAQCFPPPMKVLECFLSKHLIQEQVVYQSGGWLIDLGFYSPCESSWARYWSPRYTNTSIKPSSRDV